MNLEQIKEEALAKFEGQYGDANPAGEDILKEYVTKAYTLGRKDALLKARGKVEHLWQRPSAGGLVGMVMDGNMISRKQVLEILHTAEEGVTDNKI